jgi:hypothetical protein
MRQLTKVTAAAALVALMAACSTAPSAAPAAIPTSPAAPRAPHKASPQPPAVKPQKPAPVESNPPGDIPDNTVFVPYRSRSGGFTIKVPEGWSRTTGNAVVSFKDKLNVVTATWKKASSAPSAKRAKQVDVPNLRRTVPAFQLQGITSPHLPAGPAVLITYRANSKKNRVTGKQYRLDVLRFELFHKNEEVDLTLSSPVGADNVDPWRLISESITWK